MSSTHSTRASNRTSTYPRARTLLIRSGQAAVGTTLAALVVVGVVVAGSQVVMREQFADIPGVTAASGLLSAHDVVDAGSVVVAVVIGQTGTVASDVLAPYEVFASSGSFSVYTVAEHAVRAGPGSRREPASERRSTVARASSPRRGVRRPGDPSGRTTGSSARHHRQATVIPPHNASEESHGDDPAQPL